MAAPIKVYMCSWMRMRRQLLNLLTAQLFAFGNDTLKLWFEDFALNLKKQQPQIITQAPQSARIR